MTTETTDRDLEMRVLRRVLDWHETPANAPRRLDLAWQDAAAFFDLPAGAEAERSWDALYSAMDAMIADGRLLGELYVNRVRGLRPGYRGTMALQAEAVAQLAAERDGLEAQRSELDAERAAVTAAQAELERNLQAAETTRRQLEVRAQSLDTRANAQDAVKIELDRDRMALDRDRAIARRQAEGDRLATEAEMRAARRLRMIGALALVLAALAAVWMASSQGLV